MKCYEMMRLMDSGTCAENWGSPDLHRREHGRREDFFQVVAKRIFTGVGQQW